MNELLSKANKIRREEGYINLIRKGTSYFFPDTSLLINPITKKLSSSYYSQRLIESVLLDLEYLMGVGSGWHVDISGESELIGRFSRYNGHKIIIDVGSHEGEFSDLVLNNLDNITIHQFEPQKSCFSELERKYRDDSNVITNNFALSNIQGQATIHYAEKGAGGASLTERKLKHSDGTIEGEEQVETRTLLECVRKEDIGEIDLLKIDVEGHELDVLKGGDELFSEQKVKVCSFEFGGACIDTDTFLIDYFEFFENYGYHLYRLTHSGYLYPLPDYSEIDEKFRTTIFVAVRDSVSDDFVNVPD